MLIHHINACSGHCDDVSQSNGDKPYTGSATTSLAAPVTTRGTFLSADLERGHTANTQCDSLSRVGLELVLHGGRVSGFEQLYGIETCAAKGPRS